MNSLCEKLPGDTLPLVIRNEKEYRRLLGATKRLMEIPGDRVALEEGRLLELLSILIDEYEDRVHPLSTVEPHEMLRHLLEENNLLFRVPGRCLLAALIEALLTFGSGAFRVRRWQPCAGPHSFCCC